MTPETRIARHHLGDTLHRCYRGGAHADVWCVEAAHKGEYYPGFAPTPEAAAVAVVTQLRAAGWVPNHARLEWVPTGDGSADLCLRLDQFTQCLFFVLRWSSGRLSVYDFHQGLDENEVLREVDLTAVVAFIAGWHAANLPSLHLPPFPSGASDV